jgi:PAS domain S-box-containing protein
MSAPPTRTPSTSADAAPLFAGSGPMRARCRTFDWSATPLGPVERWSRSLRTAAHSVLASAFPGILLWGPELTQLYNDGYAPVLGAKHPWGLGRPTREVWPEAWSFNEPIYARVRAGETVSLQEQLYRLARGGPAAPLEDVYLTISYSPVLDDDDTIGGVLVTLLDVTEARRAQAALEDANAQMEEQQAELEITNLQLQENASELEARTEELERANAELRTVEERLQQVFAQAPAFLAVLRGDDHRFEFVNDAYYQLVGHREVIGRRVAEALPEVVEQGFVTILDRVLATGEPFVGRELPIMLERAPGATPEQRWVDFVYQPLLAADGARTGIVAHGSDVSVQVQARQVVEHLLEESEHARAALQGANARLEQQQAELETVNEQLVENAAALEERTVALDHAVAAVRASEQRLRDVFEQAPVAVAVLEGPDHVYTVASPRYRETPGRGRQLIGRSIREAFPEIADQGYVQTMDDVYRTGVPYAANERPVMLAPTPGGPLEERFFNVGYQPLRDVDGKVYAIASVAYDVTDHVRARRDAEEARAEAEEANRAKSQFLATMSHELRTPLNAIAGYAELLLMGVRGELNAAQREDVERMRRSGQHLLSLINDVLNFAKLEAGQVEFNPQPVDVAAVLDVVEELIRPQVDARGLRFVRPSCEPGLRVHADPEKLRQVVLNLLANAVKFTEAGGEVELACHATADRVRISVRDTGRGIAREQLARIFDPFVQVDRHLTPQSQQGVGLGLAISRDLMRAMHGELLVESTLGQGSTFTAVMPRVPEP